MPKVDFTFIPRDQPVAAPHEITDPKLPQPMVVTLQPLDDLEFAAADARADELYRRHVRGGWIHPVTGTFEKEPDPYPDIDGHPVTLTWERLQLMARIELMQSAAAEAERYRVDDLISCALKTKHAFRKLEALADETQQGGWQGKA